MVCLLGEDDDDEHGGVCTMIGLLDQQVNIGWSNKKQDSECAQEIQELDASQGSIEHIGNGYVLTAPFVPGGLDQLSRLLRRMNRYELGLVRQWKIKIAKAHESPEQLGSSSIQHDRDVHERFCDGHDMIILQESCQNKSWMLTTIFVLSKVQATHHTIFYVIGCIGLLSRILPVENLMKMVELELEPEEIGIEFAEPQTRDVQSLGQSAFEVHNALVEELECHVQENELDDGNLLHLPILVQRLVGPNTYCDVRIDGRTFFGQGGCGVVYQISWIGATCAQKVLNNVDDIKFQRATLRLASLSHPNVIPIYCGIIEKEEYPFVMELMPTNLDEVMKKRRIENTIRSFPLSVAIDILFQIAEGMRYLHDHDVVHSDLRPHNVLVNHAVHQVLGKEGYVHVKLADFGLSKITNSIPLSGGDNIARIAYMAPESWEEDLGIETPTWKAPDLRKDDPREKLYLPKKADVYSFGMTCYEVLIGCVPFHDVSDSHAMPKIIREKGRPVLPQDYPKSLVMLMENCWVHDPNRRPDFSRIVGKLRDLKQWTSFACSLYGASSSPWITNR